MQRSEFKSAGVHDWVHKLNFLDVLNILGSWIQDSICNCGS